MKVRIGAEYSRHTNAVIKEQAAVDANACLYYHISGTMDSYSAAIRILRVKATFDKVMESWSYYAKVLNNGRWQEFKPYEDKIQFN